MTLVNIDPHVILHQKMHVSSTGIFVGRSIGLPAPCVMESACTTGEKIFFRQKVIFCSYFDFRCPNFI